MNLRTITTSAAIIGLTYSLTGAGHATAEVSAQPSALADLNVASHATSPTAGAAAPRADVRPISAGHDHWVGAWEGAPEQGGAGNSALLGTQQSYRMLVHVGIGGTLVRIRLSNAFGTAAATFSDVHVGSPLGGRAAPAVQPGTNRLVTFAGRRSVTVKAGHEAYSDPVREPLRSDKYAAVSFFAPARPTSPTMHINAMTTSYLTPPGAGDHAADNDAAAFTVPVSSWYFVTGVDVLAPSSVQTVVALGDSITDCCDELPDTDTRWPDFLNRRLRRAGMPLNVVNAGISGNLVSQDGGGQAGALGGGGGQAATARLARDVLAEPNVRTVILFEGVNDVGNNVPAAKIIKAYSDIAGRLHHHHIRTLIATLTPSLGSLAYGPGYTTNYRVRDTVNTWIHQQHIFDGVIDFAAAVANPADPELWNPAYNSGDQLHPNLTGLRALANTVDLNRL